MMLCSMVPLVYLFMKTHLLALLQGTCLDLVCDFLRKEYNNILSTLAEADFNKIGHFGRYRYIGKTQISARYIRPISLKNTYICACEDLRLYQSDKISGSGNSEF